MKMSLEVAILTFNTGLLILTVPVFLFIIKGSEFMIGMSVIGLFLAWYLFDEERTRQRRIQLHDR